VDAIFVGPGDLGLRLRQTKEMTLDEAFERVAAACAKHGKAWGCPAVSPEELKKRKAQGAQLLVASSEFHSWMTDLKSSISKYD
jgi:2-keto-3-deoxy-L-rhamnonate aldolase RhmA